MRRLPFLYVFLSLFVLSNTVLGQTEDDGTSSASTEYIWKQWQSELLTQIDPDQFDTRSYAQLLEMIYDLEIENHLSDSTLSRRHPLWVRQHLVTGLKSSPLSWDHFPQSTLRYDLNARHANESRWRAGMVVRHKDFSQWKSAPLWADHVSLYASYTQSHGWLRQAVIGHYRLNLGCGLICNQRFSLGKDLSARSFFQHQPNLSVHASTLDEGYMQGTAMRLRLGQHWEVIPFVSALQDERKQNTRSQWTTHTGARARRMGEQAAIAANLLHTTQPDGTRLLQGSLDYQAQWMDCLFKGEFALDDAGGWATIDAVQTTIADWWDIYLLYRHYSDQYQQVLANSVSESSAKKGEHGVTLIAEGELSRHWTLQTTADWYRFTLPQYGICLPSQGYDFTTRANYQRTRHHHQWQGWVSYRLKAKYKSNTSTTAQDIIPYYRHSVDAQLQWLSPRGFVLQSQAHTRLYAASNVNGPQLGYALSQRVGYRPQQLPLIMELQATWFHTDSYDCRLYLSERNMLQAFSIPMLNGEGLRLSSYLRYRPSQSLSCELKYAFSNQKHILQQALFAQLGLTF